MHCYAGVSRSATCVIAYLMQERELSFEDAFSFASKRRPVIFPNMGFQRQLTEFERLLQVKRQFSVPKHVNKDVLSKLSGKNDMGGTGYQKFHSIKSNDN